ncbi:LOW QUALITY PROTEIN: Gag protein [Phytophthora palmivora]|uniref:Gag protein n=1 Tax=Phytophthora palmivora TaxID=4796 RepID=A0A2P4XZV8_9STRA|nr:LOW QUALITY PROTEIN: Gag protein [Phytophthora palmivora]
MVGIFGGDALRSLAAATRAEQVERIEAFNTHERGLIAHVQGLQAPVAELKPAQPKPLRLKGENLHFWVREVELAMDAAFISTERLRVAFALSNLGGQAKTWAYTREATTPGCFTTWAQLLEPNYEYRQRSRFLACKQGKRELHEYIQEMRVLAASLVGNPLPEHIKVTVFMDGLKVGPSRTQLFRVHANTMEEAIQIALQEEYSHRQARTPTSVWQGYNASTGAVQGAPAAGASTGPVPMELGTAVQSSIRCYGCGKLGHMQRAYPAGGQRKLPSKPRGSRGPWQKPRPKIQGIWGHQSADGARHGSLAPESLGALETRKSSSGLLVVHERVYGDPFRSVIDSGASTYLLDARRSRGMATSMPTLCVKVKAGARLANGTVVNVPGVRMDLPVKFEDFDNTESSLVLDMDKYDLILGMPWLEKHEPWVDWRGKAIGDNRPTVSDRALTGAPEDDRQGAYAPEDVLGVADSNEDPRNRRETKAHFQARGIATTASPNAESRRTVWASTVAVPDRTDQAGNIGPQAVEAAEESADGVSCVGNIGPQLGNVVPQAGSIGLQAAEAAEEDAESSSGAGNIVPRRVEETEKKIESAACVSSAGNRVPRGVKKTSTSAEVSLSTSRVDNKAPHLESEAPPARLVEEQYHVFDGMFGRQVKAGAVHLDALPEVSALLNLENLPMKDFLTEL